ncbi:WxL domain-containing protein [Vagococcus salmoninarum]|uniref:WxL domain-containing protein n=1 Tax=Vagococcus salmoninarum TaxID=2739 RepID=UPI003F9B861C
MIKYKSSILLISSLMLFSVLEIKASATEEASKLPGRGTIQYTGSDWETEPTDPEEPGTEVIPGGEIISTEGPLRLDFVPMLNFGAQVISQEDQMYFANAQLFKSDTPARANYIQVSDTRGTLAGWQLSVRQEHQFKNDNTKNKQLEGAVLSFDKQWANSSFSKEYQPTIVKDAIKMTQIDTTYPIAIAEKGKGAGTWTIEFGSSGSVEGIDNTLTPVLNADGKPLTDATVGGKPMYKNQAISLFVPGKTLKDPVKYTTILTWTISELN